MNYFTGTSTIVNWRVFLTDALKMYLEQVVPEQDDGHLKDTPSRVVRTFEDYVKGYQIDPVKLLEKRFRRGKYDEMIHVRRIQVISLCKHHMVPIVGLAHFAYIPNSDIVGLSKISRLVDCYARRLQVQENLTEQIVDTFQEVVQPKGCAINIRAVHFCMLVRGVEEPLAYTETTALRGVFKSDSQARQEFLGALDRSGGIFPLSGA